MTPNLPNDMSHGDSLTYLLASAVEEQWSVTNLCRWFLLYSEVRICLCSYALQASLTTDDAQSQVSARLQQVCSIFAWACLNGKRSGFDIWHFVCSFIISFFSSGCVPWVWIWLVCFLIEGVFIVFRDFFREDYIQHTGICFLVSHPLSHSSLSLHFFPSHHVNLCFHLSLRAWEHRKHTCTL